ncbi:hypothetical protein AGLY_016832 [Aphis glycines]|uniref:FLYWCH-type domain-containing protein n=1 Tax=Aphis glycines TaxID=307491 RepID=A0A6G0SYM9_APHGL|nr:hypothetical protein AGLY_016832 [Aphis glycines]
MTILKIISIKIFNVNIVTITITMASNSHYPLLPENPFDKSPIIKNDLINTDIINTIINKDRKANALYIIANLNNEDIEVTIDSGANINCIRPDLINKRTIIIPSNKYQLSGPDKTPLQFIGTTTINLKIENVTFPIFVCVIKNLSSTIILGNEFLEINKAKIDYTKKLITLNKTIKTKIMNTHTISADLQHNTDLFNRLTQKYVIQNNKKPQIAYGGYLYNIKKECNTMIRWRCTKSRSMKCPCIFKTDLNIDSSTLLSIEHDHVHEANENMVSAVKIKKIMKAKAKITNDAPSQFFSSAILNVPESVLAELPKEDYLKRSIRNHREYTNPPKPRCLSEIIIEGEYKKYGQERFLLYDNGPNTCSERILMFATNIGLSLLAESDTWYSDENFGLAPEFFKQLYVIPVYCILERKTQVIYEEMFNIIINECMTRDMYPAPRYLHLDFELGVMNAAKNILGNHITINGCFYHLCQSTHRKLQKLGLETIYKEESEFRKYCGMIDSLAFLPLNKVLDGMTCLKENIPPHAEDLLFYFDFYYVNGTHRRVGTASTLRLRKVTPIFPPSTWNVHELTLKGGHRTNNSTEGWNNRFSKLCGHKDPTIWNLIKKMKMEVAADQAKLALSNVDYGSTKLGTNKLIENRLKNLCMQIKNNDINVYDNLYNLKNFAIKEKYEHIALCVENLTNNELNWEIIKNMIFEIFNETEIHLLLCYTPTIIKNKKTNIISNIKNTYNTINNTNNFIKNDYPQFNKIFYKYQIGENVKSKGNCGLYALTNAINDNKPNKIITLADMLNILELSELPNYWWHDDQLIESR